MRVVSAICSVLLVSGCASFTHQAPPEAPHAVLMVKGADSDSDAFKRTVRIDGRLVRCPRGAERTYRVAPGPHTLIVEWQWMEMRDNTYYGVGAALMGVGQYFAANPAGGVCIGDYPGEQYQATYRHCTTNTVALQAGLVYVLEGPEIVLQREGSENASETSSAPRHQR